MNLASIRREIPALARCIYTNTAGFGPMPRPVWEDLRRREEAILEDGLDVEAHRPEWRAEIEAWRERLARRFGADADEIAFGRALGEGLNAVITGLSWQPGDELIITDQEHPTGFMPAANLALTRGVTVRKLVVGGSSEENFARFQELLGPRTRLVAISAVTTETGVRLPFEAIGRAAAGRAVPVYLDMAQAAGQFPLDLHASGCCSAAMSGSKWLLGPLGTAFHYFRRDWMERLEVAWSGSHSGSLDPGTELPVFATGARRFEFGGRHWPLLGAMATAVEWLAAFGLDAVQARGAALAAELKAGLAAIEGVTVLTPCAPDLSTGIVTFVLDGRRNGPVADALRERWRIRCRPALFNGVRISLAFFNTEEEVETIVGAVRAVAASQDPAAASGGPTCER